MTAAAFGEDRYHLPADISLMRVTPGDAEVLGHMLSGIDPWRRYPVAASTMVTYLAGQEAGAPRFGIRLSGDLVGAIGMRANWLRGPYIQALGLSPRVQGLGVGSAVMAWVEQEARTARDRNLWVAASEFNTRAIGFYERHGYGRVAAIDGLIADEHTEILLRKKLYPYP